MVLGGDGQHSKPRSARAGGGEMCYEKREEEHRMEDGEGQARCGGYSTRPFGGDAEEAG